MFWVQREKLQRRLINNYVKRATAVARNSEMKLHILFMYTYIYAVCVWTSLSVRSIVFGSFAADLLFFSLFFSFFLAVFFLLLRFCFTFISFALFHVSCALPFRPVSTTWDYCYNLGSEIINSFFFFFISSSPSSVAVDCLPAVAVADVVGVWTYDFFFSAFSWALSFYSTSTAGQ